MAQQPIPDFTQASNEIQLQFERMNNLPNVQLAQIANQLTQLTQTVARLDQAIVRLDQATVRLETKFDISNINNMARLQNNYAVSPDDPLTALVNLTTGVHIPDFPPDSASITRLNAAQIRAILQELGQAIPINQAGGIALLRRQLRVQLGLRGEQVRLA